MVDVRVSPAMLRTAAATLSSVSWSAVLPELTTHSATPQRIGHDGLAAQASSAIADWSQLVGTLSSRLNEGGRLVDRVAGRYENADAAVSSLAELSRVF